MIASQGIGSGLDVNSILRQLMAVERQPLNRLESKKSDLQAQLSAYGTLKSALSDFRSAMNGLNSTSDFKLFAATSSEETVFTATAGSTASKGTYDIKVSQLAEAHKMGSASFADADTTTVGNAGDQMTITVDGSSFTVDIGGKTLNEIRDAVNDATDNVGVAASVIQEDASNYYLTLTSDETGTDYSMGLSFTDSGGSPIADPLTMADINAAQDSEVVIDGTYTITRSSNIVTDAIEGVTLNLLEADTANTYNLTVERDIEGITEKAQEFVDAYNELKKSVDGLRSGRLEADNTVLSIERQLRDVLNTAPSGMSGQYTYLTEIGVSLQKDGTMSLDSDEFETAIGSDFSGVAELFAHNDQGYAYRLENLAQSFVQTDGLIDNRTDGIDNRIDAVDNRIDTMERRLTIVEDRYRAQFTALDQLVGRLQTTGNFLTQQLSDFPGMT